MTFKRFQTSRSDIYHGSVSIFTFRHLFSVSLVIPRSRFRGLTLTLPPPPFFKFVFSATGGITCSQQLSATQIRKQTPIKMNMSLVIGFGEG